jgi:hypothetical protein
MITSPILEEAGADVEGSQGVPSARTGSHVDLTVCLSNYCQLHTLLHLVRDTQTRSKHCDLDVFAERHNIIF